MSKKKTATPGPKKPRPRRKPATAGNVTDPAEHSKDGPPQAWERGGSVRTSPHKWEE